MAPNVENNNIGEGVRSNVLDTVKMTLDAEESSFIFKVFDTIFSIVVFVAIVIILPFGLVLSVIFRIYRHKLKEMVLETEGGRVAMVADSDSIWLQDSCENRAVINSLIIMNGKADIDMWRSLISERLVEAVGIERPKGEKLFPKITMFNNKLYRRYVWMEEENFDMKDHVFFHDETIPESQRELERMIGELCSTPLPVNKSPWQFVLIKSDKRESDTYYAVFRVHHAIADGISLVRLLMNRLVDHVTEETIVRRYGSTGKTAKIIKGILFGPALLLKRLAWPADQSVLHGVQLFGKKQVSWSEKVDLEPIKKIKNLTGTTVNDVLVSCLAGAFREYLLQYGKSIPKDVSSYIPVDVRPLKGKLVLDNQFALVFLHLPTSAETAIETLAMTKARMDHIKSSPEALVNSMVIKYCMARLPNWFTTMAFNWLSRKCSLVLSNVPGPQYKLTIGGEAVEDIMFWPPQRSNVGLGVSIFTYHGSVRVGVMSDKAVLTNPNLLATEFVKKVHELASELKVD